VQVGADFMYNGKLFHNLGPATTKVTPTFQCGSGYS